MKKIGLVILDGLGIAPDSPDNAVYHANMPACEAIISCYPHGTLAASGQAVGLPPGMVGNSEAGHLTLGAGAIVPSVQQQLAELTADTVPDIVPAFIEEAKKCAEKKTPMHFIGLLSDGGIHSDIAHLKALLEAADRVGVQKIYVHAILDGRDVAAQSAAQYILLSLNHGALAH